MITKTFVLPPQDFFHARPAARVAAAAKPFQSVILIMIGPNLADAHDPIAMMRLPFPNGAPIDLVADGPDEQQAVDAVWEELCRVFQLSSPVTPNTEKNDDL